MGKGDSKHKSRFAGKRRRQRKLKERMGRQDAEKRRWRKAEGHVPASGLTPKQYKKTIVSAVDQHVKCPHCNYRVYAGQFKTGDVVRCPSCHKDYEIVREVAPVPKPVQPSPPPGDLPTAIILPDSWAFCPHPGCGYKNDVLHKKPGDVVECGRCNKKFRLVTTQPTPQPAVSAPPPPPPPPSEPPKSTKPTVHRSGNSPWCTCPECSRGIRIRGSYTTEVDVECPYCNTEFTALPA